MIDFIKSFNCGLDASVLVHNEFLKFLVTYDPNTGEVPNRNRYSTYNGITFSISSNATVGISGSLHKYHNEGIHNHDDFSYSKLLNVIKDLYAKFGINPKKVYLNNLEFGVNIELPYKPQILFDNLVSHKCKPFLIEQEKKMQNAWVNYENYRLKIYDKGLQYGLNNDLLRIEVKVMKMAFISKVQIKTLWDLTDIQKLNKLKDILIYIYDEILFSDSTIDLPSLTHKEQEILKDGGNPKYWAIHKSKAGSNSSKRMRHYKTLVRKYGSYKFHRVGELIDKKVNSLLSYNEETLRVLTDFQKELDQPIVRVLTESQKGLVNSDVRVLTKFQEDKFDNYVPIGVERNTSFNNSSIVENLVSDSTNKKVCMVTGIDISMQSENSRFLSYRGINYLYKNNREQFDILLSKLPSKYTDAPFKEQVYKIAHYVRDQFFNKRNPTRRKINKLLKEPSLFNNLPLIREDSLRIANTV